MSLSAIVIFSGRLDGKEQNNMNGYQFQLPFSEVQHEWGTNGYTLAAVSIEEQKESEFIRTGHFQKKYI